MNATDATSPIEVMFAIAESAAELDRLGKEMDRAINEYDDANEAWLELYDNVAEDLEDEMKDKGRGPAEHTIVSTARRQHRAEFNRWKRAKHQREKLAAQMKATGEAMSGRQSQLGALRDEMRADAYERRGG